MRVAIDARHVGRGRGIARYLEEMLASLASRYRDDEWVAVVPSGDEVRLPPGVELRRTRLRSRPTFAASALLSRPRLDRIAGGADLCWIPAPAPVACDVPYVLTLHDRSFEESPQFFTMYERLWHALARPRQLARNAAELAIVSQASLDDLLSHNWPIDPQHCSVIRPAPTLAVTAAQNTRADVQGSYLLFVGALEPRKGVDTLAAAARIARRAGLTQEIVIVGSGRSARDLLGIDRVRILGRQTDEQLAALYANSYALLVPSRAEGFGSPVAEAARLGVPSIISDLPVFSETVGDAALRFEPGNPDAMASAMVKLCSDTTLREQLGESAKQGVSQLSWDSAASELYKLFEGALAER